MVTKLILSVDRSAERELGERVQRLRPNGRPIKPTPLVQAVQFLRGVDSRSTFALPSFYLFLAAKSGGDTRSLIDGYPGTVLTHAIEFSAISTVALSCRKVFDHDPRKMTGKAFADISDATLEAVAAHWAEKSKRPLRDALAALQLLRSVFQDCSKTDTALFDDASPLGRRIGLLKQYANRAAAHLSIESYEFSSMDCAHVVAAITMIGAIVMSFDRPDALPSYFDTLDEAAAKGAQQLFLGASDIRRLFSNFKVETQARLCWQFGVDQGRQMLLEQLPYATGWF